MADPIKLPPGATLVEDAPQQDAGIKLPPGAQMVTDDTPPPPSTKPLGPLDTLSAWGQRTFAPISREDAKKSESDALNPARSPAPEVARDVANAGGAMMRTITSAPAGIADWLKQGFDLKQYTHPIQYEQERLASHADPSKPTGVKPSFTSEDVNDLAADKGGQLAAGVAMGEAGGAALEGGLETLKGGHKLVTKVTRPLIENATDTTPRITASAVRDTSAENVAAGQEHLGKTQDALHETEGRELKYRQEVKAAEDKRKLDLKKHFEDTQRIKKANEDAAKLNSRRGAIERGVEKSDEPLREGLKKTLKEVKDEADRRYNTQRAELNDKQIPFDGRAAEDSSIVTGENFAEKAKDAWSSTITGSDTLPPIIKSIQDRVNVTQPITWRDLQGYRSEIGRKLSGDLPGDEYFAYKKVLNLIDDGMQKIADQNGMGRQIRADRAFYRQYMDTFRDPNSPVYKALNAKERGGTVKALQGADRTGIEAIAPYNKELPKKLNTLRNLQAEASSLPVKVTPKEVPKPAPREPLPAPPERVAPPDRPQEKTLSPNTISAMKKENLLKATDQMRHSKSPLVSAVAGYGTIKALLLRNLPTAGLDIAARVLYGAAKPALADMLENPKIMDELTKFTARDATAIAKLPADQRAAFVGDFKPVVDAARAKGVKVSPALIGILAGTQSNSDPADRKSVAAALTSPTSTSQ